jgi:hypothetical protein
MKRFLFIILILITTISSGWADQPRIQKTLDHMKMALNNHDFEILVPHLAANFSYNSYEGEMAQLIMRQIVDQYPKAIESISIKNIEKSGQQFNVTAEFLFQGESEEKMLILASDYKIVKAPIVQIQMAKHGSDKLTSSIGTDVIPVRMVAPFKLADRLIVVEAEVEGVRGNFIVDSGAPLFILNSKRLPMLASKAQNMDHSVHGVGGKINNTKWVEASSFIWQDVKLSSIKGLIFDLSHLEENTQTELVGLIGADFLKKFTVEFDYADKELTLFTDNPEDYWHTTPSATIEFDMIGHIPVIDVSIGTKSFSLGIDSGCEDQMLNPEWEAPLSSHCEFIRADELRGADTTKQVVEIVRLDVFEVGGIRYSNHEFQFSRLNFGHEVKMDGLIGYEFLSEYRTAIDYKHQKLYIWNEINRSKN